MVLFLGKWNLEAPVNCLLVFSIYETIEVIEYKASANPYFSGGLAEAFLCFKYTFMFGSEAYYE